MNMKKEKSSLFHTFYILVHYIAHLETLYFHPYSLTPLPLNSIKVNATACFMKTVPSVYTVLMNTVYLTIQVSWAIIFRILFQKSALLGQKAALNLWYVDTRPNSLKLFPSI